MVSKQQAVVIGGGVIGCSIAYHLAVAGVSVTVVEKNNVGSGASGVAAGMIACLSEGLEQGHALDFAIESRLLLLDMMNHLQQESGIDLEYRCPGILHLAITPEDEKELTCRMEWQGPLNMGVEWLSPKEVNLIEPAIKHGIIGALFSPNEGHLNSRRLVRAYSTAAARKGVDFVQYQYTESLIYDGSRVVGVRTSHGTIKADWVIIATGAWSARSGEWLGLEIPVRPIKGQIIAVRSFPSPVTRIVWNGLTYLVPKADGSILIGTTREDVGFDQEPSVDAISGLLTNAMALVPTVSNAQFHKVWAGLRPCSPDQLPILGRVPGLDGVLLALGHYRSGMLLSAATGKRISDFVVKGDERPLLPFTVSRFMT